MQGNLEMYSAENQQKRSALKRSEKMRELARNVWAHAANQHETMNKAEFEVTEQCHLPWQNPCPYPSRCAHLEPYQLTRPQSHVRS